jgi:hypothetical protein
MSRMKRRKFLKSAGAAAVAGSVIGSTRCFPLFGSWAQAAGNARRIAEWHNQRFGMFIHWGPVSLKGTEIGWSRGAQVPVEEYDSLYRQFNPSFFDAGE